MTSQNWFEIDKAGLAKILDRRGRAWALFELLQNAWDSGAKKVLVTVDPIPNSPFMMLTVEDDSSEGWSDLSDAFKLFGKSRRAADVTKRGRFCFGEKMVLSLCRKATIRTMQGTVYFEEDGTRRTTKERTTVGTKFYCEMRMTRDEMDEMLITASTLIPPVETRINGKLIERGTPVKTFETKLPTEVADEETGELKKRSLMTFVSVYATDGVGQVLEMGIPVCDIDCPFRINVGQKIPLGLERNSVADVFRKAVIVAVLNETADRLSEEQSAAPWVSEAIGDVRCKPETLQRTIVKRFGERAVVANPADPLANAQAVASGCQLIHGGSLSGQAWANLRKHSIVPTSSQSFPQPKPEVVPTPAPTLPCPTCGR